MSNGLGRKVGAELGTNHATVPMGAGHLPPDHSCPVGLATGGYGVAEEREKELLSTPATTPHWEDVDIRDEADSADCFRRKAVQHLGNDGGQVNSLTNFIQCNLELTYLSSNNYTQRKIK